MAERIDRSEDQRKYQPKLHRDRIHELYLMKQETGQPMTVILDRAVRENYHVYRQSKPIEKNNYLPE